MPVRDGPGGQSSPPPAPHPPPDPRIWLPFAREAGEDPRFGGAVLTLVEAVGALGAVRW